MKKALALILSLVMVFALIPSAFAEDTPAVAKATLMTELPDTGDRIVIHNYTYNKALDACGTSGHYNAGVDIVPEDGILTGVSENIVWDFRWEPVIPAHPMTTSTRTGRSRRTATDTAS